MSGEQGSETLLALVDRKLSLGISFSDISMELGLHRNSLRKKLEKEFGNEWKGVRNCRDITLDDICTLIKQHVPLTTHGSNWGCGHVMWHLRKRGLRISKMKIAEALRVLQPEQVERRSLRRLWRAVYDVTEPMALWHMDSYDKLSTWGFRVHGCIDGASHFVVYAKLATNKRKETIFSAYREAIFKYGHPLRIRSDHAAEHVLVQRDMEIARPDPGNLPPFLQGSSVHNQRIERFWRHLSEKFAFYYKAALFQLGEDGILDMRNSVHRTSLLRVFFPVLEEELKNWIETWNSHRVRGQWDNGRSIPGHVPARVFQSFERERGIIHCPEYEDSEHREASFTHLMAREILPGGSPLEEMDILEQNVTDIQDVGIQEIRDVAYEGHKLHLSDIKERFWLFLNLTVIYLQAEESQMDLKLYLESVRQHSAITSFSELLFSWNALYSFLQ